MENTNKEQLVTQLIELKKKYRELSKQIDAIDYAERFNIANGYVGKYYKESTNSDNIRCLFVYGVDQENCRPLSLCISYYNDSVDAHFGIEYYSYFKLNEWDDDDICKWVEITKDEYQYHYDQVQSRISKLFEL